MQEVKDNSKATPVASNGKSLLELAKAEYGARKNGTKLGDQHIELAIAWARGEITTTQVGAALNCKRSSHGSIYNFLASALRLAVLNGILVQPGGGK